MLAELCLCLDPSVSPLIPHDLSVYGVLSICMRQQEWNQSEKQNCLQNEPTHLFPLSKIKWPITKIATYLAISALLFASSAIWLSSVKCVRSVNILVSGGCNPCNVLCACAHWSSRCSFPKSFCLVKAIYIFEKSINNCINKDTIEYGTPTNRCHTLCSMTRSQALPLKA